MGERAQPARIQAEARSPKQLYSGHPQKQTIIRPPWNL
jgi:hypothetical protein